MTGMLRVSNGATCSQSLERSVQDPAFPFSTGRGTPGTNVLNLIPA